MIMPFIFTHSYLRPWYAWGRPRLMGLINCVKLYGVHELNNTSWWHCLWLTGWFPANLLPLLPHIREWMCNNANNRQNNNGGRNLPRWMFNKKPATVFICFWNLWQIDIVVHSPTQLLNFLSANFHGFRGLRIHGATENFWTSQRWLIAQALIRLVLLMLPHQQKTGADKSPTMRVGVPLWNVWAIVRIVTLFAEITRLKTRRPGEKTVWVPFVIWGRAESLTRLSFTHEDTFGIN